MNYLRKFLLFTNSISLIFYVYFSTKYIDFALFVAAWMDGYKIGHEFLRMSYLITKSCCKNQAEPNLDETECEKLKLSNSLAYSFIESEYSTDEPSLDVST